MEKRKLPLVEADLCPSPPPRATVGNKRAQQSLSCPPSMTDTDGSLPYTDIQSVALEVWSIDADLFLLISHLQPEAGRLPILSRSLFS